MAISIDINDIISQVKKMDKKDQVNLLDRILLLVQKPELKAKESQGLSSLSNFKNHTWTNVDIEKYIEDERQW